MSRETGRNVRVLQPGQKLPIHERTGLASPGRVSPRVLFTPLDAAQPVSACVCQSPSWKYYGEVDAKNKFLGKSFEIRPTGIAHCELRLPIEWAPSYPTGLSGKAIEHYSWKKVTTSVSNFIMGSPTIDHFGDMVSLIRSEFCDMAEGYEGCHQS